MKRLVHYVLMDENGERVERYHQDDESDPVQCSTIEGLIDYASERIGDRGCRDFLEEMQPGGEFENWRIVRQVTEFAELDATEQAELAAYKQKLQQEHEEWERQWEARRKGH